MATWIRRSRSDVAAGVLLFGHLFFTAAGTVVGKAARDALFLSRFTPLQMMATDLVTIVAVAIALALQFRLTARVSTRRVLLVSPLCFALGDLALWTALSTSQAAWLTRAVYLWLSAQGSLGTPQASVLVSHTLTLRKAKSLCGPIGAGAILGWIAGGAIARALSIHCGAASLLLGAAALAMCCPLLVRRAWRAAPADDVSESGPAPAPASLRRSASLVWTSSHLRAVATLALVSSAVTTIAGLQFRAIASQSFRAADELAAFFGSFSMYSGLLALGTQLLLSSQVIGRMGTGLALAVAPTALAIGSAGVLCSNTLGAAVLLKGSDHVFRVLAGSDGRGIALPAAAAAPDLRRQNRRGRPGLPPRRRAGSPAGALLGRRAAPGVRLARNGQPPAAARLVCGGRARPPRLPDVSARETAPATGRFSGRPGHAHVVCGRARHGGPAESTRRQSCGAAPGPQADSSPAAGSVPAGQRRSFAWRSARRSSAARCSSTRTSLAGSVPPETSSRRSAMLSNASLSSCISSNPIASRDASAGRSAPRAPRPAPRRSSTSTSRWPLRTGRS